MTGRLTSFTEVIKKRRGSVLPPFLDSEFFMLVIHGDGSFLNPADKRVHILLQPGEQYVAADQVRQLHGDKHAVGERQHAGQVGRGAHHHEAAVDHFVADDRDPAFTQEVGPGF